MESLAPVIAKYALAQIDKGDAPVWMEFKVDAEENPSNDTKL
jgi:hypothetical protein